MRSDARGNDLQRNFIPPDGAAAEAAAALGPMPEWNLADLYPVADGARDRRAISTAAAAEARRIKEAYHGKLVGLAADGGVLALADRGSYERFDELIGRLGSYAGLLYAGDQADPERAKFYGDMSEKLTAISTGSDLLRAGAQPDRRGGDGAGADRTRVSPATSRGSTTSARRSRTSSTKSSSGCSTRRARPARERLQPAVQRDHDGAALPGRRRARAVGAGADAQPAVEPGRDEARRRGRGACQGVQGQRARCSR